MKYVSAQPIVVFCFILVMLRAEASAQQGQLLQPVPGPARAVAYFNDSLLRKQYTAFRNFRSELRQSLRNIDTARNAAVTRLDSITQKQLNADSLTGGQQKAAILQQAATEKERLLNEAKEKKKAWQQAGVLQLQAFGKNIQRAIRKVLLEKNYSSVKILKNGETHQPDITGLVLQKLQ